MLWSRKPKTKIISNQMLNKSLTATDYLFYGKEKLELKYLLELAWRYLDVLYFIPLSVEIVSWLVG